MLLAVSSMLLTAEAALARGAFTDDPDSVFYKDEETATPLRYDTTISGIDDKSLLKLLESSSQLFGLEDRPPPTIAALERRVRADVDRMQKVLRSEGYYSARVEYRLEPDESPVGVFLDIVPGAQYTLSRYTIRYSGPGSNDPDLPRDPADIGLTLGESARAERVKGARQQLLKKLADMGHPLATVIDQKAVVDRADNTMRVTIEVAPGDRARFGAMEIAGADDVETDYIETFIVWKEGEIFDQRKLNETRHELLDTGLFAAVAFERPKKLDADGKLPITVRVEERKHRSIGLGARWSSDEGFAVEGQWEHRNLFGRGEVLSLVGELGEIKQEFAANFKKPRFLRPDQSLLASAALANEDTDAFSGPLTKYFLGAQRRVTRNWKVIAGVPIEFSDLSDLQGSREFALVGLEGRGIRDSSNDRLDPTSGSRTTLTMRPWYGFGDSGVTFVKGIASVTSYDAIDDDERYVLAGRARIGSIVGESTAALPANKRFYAGGGASIRGYRFQSVGPLGPGNTPLGGRSLFELSAEIRTKVTDTIGGVLFIDGGNVYDDELPNLTQGLQWSVGVGGRYFTGFGPIRLDLGFPINPREGIDDFMQFYISIGQAF